MNRLAVCGHWPKTKDKYTPVVVLDDDVLFYLSHFLFKRNLSEKILTSRESNQCPWTHQSSALSTELQIHCYTMFEE